MNRIVLVALAFAAVAAAPVMAAEIHHGPVVMHKPVIRHVVPHRHVVHCTIRHHHKVCV